MTPEERIEELEAELRELRAAPAKIIEVDKPIDLRVAEAIERGSELASDLAVLLGEARAILSSISRHPATVARQLRVVPEEE